VLVVQRLPVDDPAAGVFHATLAAPPRPVASNG
jgi:hypothetical protein